MQHRRFIGVALLSAAALVVCLAAPRPASAHQYIVNGGFEEGTSSWSILSDGSTFDTAPDDVSPVAGASRARIVLGQANFRLNQSIADVPSGTYRVTISVRVESTSAIVRLEILTNPAWANPFSPTTFRAAPGEWQDLSVDVAIPGASLVSIRLTGSGAAGDRIYIDQVGFDGAAPATMTPTSTHTPLPPSVTPIPPTATKTAKPTTTATHVPTATPLADATHTLSSSKFSNGGFEDVADGSPVAWNKYGGTLSSAQSPVRTGTHSAKLQSTTESTKWLYQTVAVTGGVSYTFDAWIWHDDPHVASAYLRVSWYSSSDGSGEAIGTTDSSSQLETPTAAWRHVTVAGATAPPDAQTAKLRIMMQLRSPASSAIYADDAGFTPADPATSGPPPVVTTDERTAPSASTSRGTAGRADATHHRSVSSVQPAGDASGIVINEILYDSLDSSDAAGEWIELFNAGAEPVDLTGWFIADNTAADELPALTVGSHKYAIIVASDRLLLDMIQSNINAVRVAGNIGNSLNNAGDTVVLVDPSGRIVDAVSWGEDPAALDPPAADVPAGHSLERRLPGVDTNSRADFIDNERPSPGMPYTAAAAATRLPTKANDVQILSQEQSARIGWLVWAIAAAAMGTLAAVASWRLVPALTQRLRHG